MTFTKGHKPYGRALNGHITSEETKIRIGLANKGKSHNSNFRPIGNLNPMYGKEQSQETIKKIRDTKKARYKLGLYNIPKGINHYKWKGGITKERTKIWRSQKYKTWRKAVFERDSYTCWCCGIEGSNLHAHHIMEFAKYPEQRFDIDNGITLCKDCHCSIRWQK